MPHESKVKVKLPKYIVLTTDGSSNTTYHGATNDPVQARLLHDDNAGSVVVKGGHVDSSFDKPVKPPK